MIEEDAGRGRFLDIIESEKLIDGRFTDVKRIDENGGGGCFSLLFKSHDLQTGNTVALKFYDPTKYFESERVKRFQREAELLKQFQNESYVINFIAGPCELQRKIVDEETGIQIPIPFKFIAIELADFSIEDFIYLKDNDSLAILLLFKEMIKAVSRFHRGNACHRDLKPSNFLVVDRRVCLSDFGTAKFMNATEPNISQSYRYPVGDYTYSAPELFCSIGIADEYVFLADFFSMGAILFEMFTKNILTNEIYNADILEKLSLTRHVISQMRKENKIETYKGIVQDLAKSTVLPDIYSYNDNVPNCIKNHLNGLYKNLAAVSFFRRLNNVNSIHRQLDLCILILRNEKKYHAMLERKRKRRLQRLNTFSKKRKFGGLQC